MVKYNSKVVRLSKDTIELLEEIKVRISSNPSEFLKFIVSDSNYDKIIKYLCLDYLNQPNLPTRS